MPFGEKILGTNSSPHMMSTVMLTLSTAEQPDALVVVTTQIPELDGEAKGFGQFVQLKPLDGDHE